MHTIQIDRRSNASSNNFFWYVAFVLMVLGDLAI